MRGQFPTDEVQIYTWFVTLSISCSLTVLFNRPDATLKELADLLKDVIPAARRKSARLSFAFVYPDKRGQNVMKQVGMVSAMRKLDDENKTLASLRFQTGDFLDIAIYC